LPQRYTTGELEGRAAQYTARYHNAIKSPIFLMDVDGPQDNEIAESLLLPVLNVTKRLNRFHQHRLPGLTERPQGGAAHPSFTKADRGPRYAVLRQGTEAHGFSTSIHISLLQ